jgi:hypothetical protein
MQKSQTKINPRSRPPIPPMPLYQAALVFAATSVLFFGCLYVVLPLLRRHNISWFASFNLALAAPMFLLVGCALFAYAREGNQPRWQDLRDRFRLHRMDLTSWVWTSGLAIFMFGGRSRVCRSVSKKHLARHHRPYCGEQRHLNWNRSWDRGLKGSRAFVDPSILAAVFSIVKSVGRVSH